MSLIDKIDLRLPENVESVDTHNAKMVQEYKGSTSMYPAAEVSRLTNGWPTFPYNPDAELRFNLRTIRARARNLYATNDYARRFVKMCGINVIGKDGITLTNKASDLRPKKDKDGTTTWLPVLDKYANRVIQDQWWNWGKRGICTIDGQLSFKDAQRMIMETIARDGEIIIRRRRDAANPFRYAIQILEADHLDESYTRTAPSGNQIIMGIEKDVDGKPVAYWLLKQHPGTTVYPMQREYVRILAEDVYHPYIMERPTQTRGIPWTYTALTRLNNIGAYEEAAIMAARIGASNMGIFTSPTGDVNFGAKDEVTGKYVDGKDAKGNTILEAEPGMFITAPEGTDFKEFNPKYPTGEYGPFIKSTLRGVAAGLGVTYNSLASDLESVNYSSLRSGAIEERDGWKVIQDWFIENIMDRIFADWLDQALMTGNIPLPYAKFDKFNAPVWRARGFDWVDPQKDMQAAAEAVEVGFRTRTDVCAEKGLDFEEVLQELQHEEELIKKYGINIAMVSTGRPTISEPAPTTPNPDTTSLPPKKDQPANVFNITTPPVTVNAPVTVNTPENKVENHIHAAPITVNTPETKVENNIQPAAVTVNTPEMKVENYTTVEPSAPASVTVAPAEIKIENKFDVQAAPAPNVEVKLGDTKIENKFPKPAAKKPLVMKGRDGEVIRTIEEK